MKTYIEPAIKIKEINAVNLMAASLSIEGDTGIGFGSEPDPNKPASGSTGNAKQNSVWAVWNDETE